MEENNVYVVSNIRIVNGFWFLNGTCKSTIIWNIKQTAGEQSERNLQWSDRLCSMDVSNLIKGERDV